MACCARSRGQLRTACDGGVKRACTRLAQLQLAGGKQEACGELHAACARGGTLACVVETMAQLEGRCEGEIAASAERLADEGAARAR